MDVSQQVDWFLFYLHQTSVQATADECNLSSHGNIIDKMIQLFDRKC